MSASEFYARYSYSSQFDRGYKSDPLSNDDGYKSDATHKLYDATRKQRGLPNRLPTLSLINLAEMKGWTISVVRYRLKKTGKNLSPVFIGRNNTRQYNRRKLLRWAATYA